MKAIVYVGIPASGKSEEAAYLVNEKDWVELNRDDIRFEIHNDGVRDWTKYKFSKKNEDEVSFLSGGEVNVSDLNAVLVN